MKGRCRRKLRRQAVARARCRLERKGSNRNRRIEWPKLKVAFPNPRASEALGPPQRLFRNGRCEALDLGWVVS